MGSDQDSVGLFILDVDLRGVIIDDLNVSILSEHDI